MSAWGSLHEGRRSPLNSFCGLRKEFKILYKEKWRTNLISWHVVELFLSALRRSREQFILWLKKGVWNLVPALLCLVACCLRALALSTCSTTWFNYPSMTDKRGRWQCMEDNRRNPFDVLLVQFDLSEPWWECPPISQWHVLWIWILWSFLRSMPHEIKGRNLFLAIEFLPSSMVIDFFSK